MRDTTTLADLMFDDGTGKNEEGGREWDHFGQEYTIGPDGFPSLLTGIQSKRRSIEREGTRENELWGKSRKSGTFGG